MEVPNDFSAKIEGRSSLGRLGIQIHSTAGHFTPALKIESLWKFPILARFLLSFIQA